MKKKNIYIYINVWVHLLNCFLSCLKEKICQHQCAGKKCNLSHLLSHSRSNPNILTTNKSTFQFIKSVNSIQVAVPRQALYCVPNCILWPWWMGCQLRKTGWFQLKTLSSAPQVRKRADRILQHHMSVYSDLFSDLILTSARLHKK